MNWLDLQRKETSIRIDYDKIRMLIRHDKNFDHDASIIQELVTKGYFVGTGW